MFHNKAYIVGSTLDCLLPLGKCIYYPWLFNWCLIVWLLFFVFVLIDGFFFLLQISVSILTIYLLVFSI